LGFEETQFFQIILQFLSKFFLMFSKPYNQFFAPSREGGEGGGGGRRSSGSSASSSSTNASRGVEEDQGG